MSRKVLDLNRWRNGGWSMMLELQATYSALKKWKQNSAATRRQIDVWQHWKQEREDNDRPLTEIEVTGMKAFLQRNAPTSYFEIFSEERNRSTVDQRRDCGFAK
jgi:hypothetical protein